MDSLTKFHFAKLELSEVRKKRDEWQSNYFTLNAQAVGCKNDFIEEKKVNAGLRVEIADLKTEIIIKSQKLFKSNLEKWAWRIGSALGSYFLIK